jgi:hypothetical protein
MNKLGKDHTQKIALGALMAIGVIYGYFHFLLLPLKANTRTAIASIAALDPEIGKAKAQLQRAIAVEKEAPAVEATVASINALIPEGAPVAWFPVVIGDHFKKAGFDKVTTKMSTEIVEKELPGYRRITWNIDMPRVESLTFGPLLAKLENREPLVEVQSISMETLREEPEAQRVILTARNIVK